LKHAFFKRIFKTVARKNDGPGVIRSVTPKADLERDPQLHGQLEPPPGISTRLDPSGVRVMTINIHMAVPDGLSLDPRNENLGALQDVAHFINKMNPDVVMVQELRNRPVLTGGAGLGDAVSVLAHLMKATQMAYTPAIRGEVKDGKFGHYGAHYGTAIYTRNGFTIKRAVNIALPNNTEDGKAVEPRSAGIAVVSPPKGHARFTVISTHLSVEEAALRKKQLGALAAIVQSIRARGGFTYQAAMSGEKRRVGGFPRTIILGGDLNQQQETSDAVLKGSGLTHVNDFLADKKKADIPTVTDNIGRTHRIDHLYVTDIEATDVVVAAVPGRVYTAGAPTDHKAVIADVRKRQDTALSF